MLDYLGVRPEVSGLTIDACYPRACNLIYNEWYRDQNLQNSLPVPTDDGPDDPSIYQLFRRGKRGDYFTTALPSPQRGPGASLPLGDKAPVAFDTQTVVIGEDNTAPYKSDQFRLPIFNGANNHYLGATLDFQNTQITGTTNGYFSPGNPINSGMFADLSDATAASINSLRKAVAVQHFLEIDNRGGTRYIEKLYSHFGVISPDARLQRPEFLGSFSANLNQNTVAQTSQTTQGANGSPQANLSAYSIFSATSNSIEHSFTEHGMLIGFVNIRADLSYQYGLDRELTRRTQFDFYWPEFANLGDQEIKNKEIYADGTDEDDGIFGYQERNAEYRYKNNMITGKLRSGVTGTLDIWHLGQRFANRPVLNSEFIEDNPDFDRVIAVQNEPQFIMDAQFDYWHTRCMPLYGLPGLIRL